MKPSRPFWSIFFRLLFFIALSIFSIFLISHNGVIQKYALLNRIREAQIAIWNNTNSIKDYFALDEINSNLSRENQALLAQNIKYRELITSLKGEQTLEKLLDSANIYNNNYEYVWAEVVKNMVNTSHNFIIVNKGRKDGVTLDMGAITNNGVIGVVRSVGENHSYISSLLNTNQQLSVKVGESNSLGILCWDGINSNGAILNEIPRHIKIEIGDTVRTSGYSSLFPPNIKVGEVVSSKVVKGTHLELGVELFNDFTTLDYVVLVSNNNKLEIDSLSNAL